MVLFSFYAVLQMKPVNAVQCSHSSPITGENAILNVLPHRVMLSIFVKQLQNTKN